MPPLGFVGADLALVPGVIGKGAADMQYAAFAKHIVKSLDDLFVPGDVLQRLRADDLIKFAVNLRKIVEVADFEFQPFRVGPQERKILRVLLHLAGFKGHAQDPVPTLVGSVGEGSIAATCVQGVDVSVPKISGKKAIAASGMDVKSWKKQSLSPKANSIAHRE
jgi:hypothetical protein